MIPSFQFFCTLHWKCSIEVPKAHIWFVNTFTSYSMRSNFMWRGENVKIFQVTKGVLIIFFLLTAKLSPTSQLFRAHCFDLSLLSYRHTTRENFVYTFCCSNRIKSTLRSTNWNYWWCSYLIFSKSSAIALYSSITLWSNTHSSSPPLLQLSIRKYHSVLPF